MTCHILGESSLKKAVFKDEPDCSVEILLKCLRSVHLFHLPLQSARKITIIYIQTEI